MSTALQTNIVEQIKTTFEAAQEMAALAGSHAQMAIQSAVACGKLLNQVKGEQEHGQWLKWLGANCPFIETRTAQNWMRLASNTKTLSQIETFKNKSEAYKAIGILPEQSQSTSKAPSRAPLQTWEQPIQSLGVYLREDTIHKLKPEALDMIEEQLKKLIERIEEAKAKRGAVEA